MLANKTLVKIAVYGGVFTACSGGYFYMKIQETLMSSPYFKESIQLLQNHKGAIELLGEPMLHGRLNLSDTENNFCDGHNAQFEVPVKGPKNSGTLFFQARRETPEQKWHVHKLELTLTKHKTKPIVIINE